MDAMQTNANAGPVVEYKREQFVISTDAERLDLDVIHRFLTNSYWANGIPREVVERSIQNSLVFGLFDGNTQIGFARVITDLATFAYIGDVFVLDAYRGRGLGKWMMECIEQHPSLQGLRRWSLVTRDAHGLYARCGFIPLKKPENWMERHNPSVYDRSAS
jgi:GNAT superfamily N-acetyltransferase